MTPLLTSTTLFSAPCPSFGSSDHPQDCNGENAQHVHALERLTREEMKERDKGMYVSHDTGNEETSVRIADPSDGCSTL